MRNTIEDQGRAVQHPACADQDDVTFLNGAEGLADQHQVGAGFFDEVAEFFDLAAAHVGTGIRPVAWSGDDTNHLGPGGAGQFLEFIECIRPGEPEFGMQYDSAVAALGSIDQVKESRFPAPATSLRKAAALNGI